VSPGGAFDQESLALAKALLGNERHTSAIELAMGAAKLEAVHETRISVLGAGSRILIDSRPAPCQAAFHLLPGQNIAIESPTKGARVYIGLPAVDQDVPPSPIRVGALLSGRVGSPISAKPITVTDAPSSVSHGPIRAISYNDNELPTEACTVSLDSDRVGIRLEGLKLTPGEESLSEPACPGTIQVTNDGNLVILGPDGPTIGGYRKIGVVCSADIDRLAQLRPGQQISFESITCEEAVAAWQQRNQELEAKLAELRLRMPTESGNTHQ
jgi:5-oxoprolinase (ATP-hydrolysing) subunit C